MNPDTRARCGHLVRLLGSPIDGEALGAARALGRVLKGAGGSLDDLASEIARGDSKPRLIFEGPPNLNAPQDWRDIAHWLARYGEGLNHWEANFVADVALRQARGLSDRQMTTLHGIYRRVRRVAA